MMSNANDPDGETFDPFNNADPFQSAPPSNNNNMTSTIPPSTSMMDDSSSFAPITVNTNSPLQQSPPAAATPSGGENTTFFSKLFSCLTVEAYRDHFDVTTADIQHRIVTSLRHFNDMDGMKEVVLQGKNPDAYGPFWISTTLVFFVAVTSNMSAYLHAEEKDAFEYDVSHLFRAMTLLYAYTYLLPLLYYFIFNCLSFQMTFMDLVCLYGYSLVPYCPVTLLCIVPDNFLVWFLLIGATVVSLIFVLRNVVGVVMRGEDVRQKQIAGPVLCSIIGCHVVFLLILKLGFYHHVKGGGDEVHESVGL
eukprot:CAMPEP_0172505610 /NCGR_PEP_ID=MMETSP1066-20121228/187702_1 /TAXON_ID=671091 /ORGANISM="Coscinodiscus wailesii, Strain CCMP2513" /LENGTH=305 /DNA_ID=CAMNT_0013282289 /DNA_START=195 /DNA_END=1112 /DNA_ORIENTATION=-